jgi:hypothetical protein
MECIELVKKTELTPKQKKAILHLLSAKTIRDASISSGVRLPTLFKWLREPAFRDELDRLRDEVVSDVVGRLKTYSLEAVTVLGDLMKSSKSETIQSRCAKDLLENCRSFIGLKDLEVRLAAIESALSNTQPSGGNHFYQAIN